MRLSGAGAQLSGRAVLGIYEASEKAAYSLNILLLSHNYRTVPPETKLCVNTHNIAGSMLSDGTMQIYYQLNEMKKINVKYLRGKQGTVAHENDSSIQESETTSHKFQTKLDYIAIFNRDEGTKELRISSFNTEERRK